MPCGAVRTDVELALQLKRRDAFLCRADQGECHEPLAQRQMRILEDRSDGDAELLVAVVAFVDAVAVRLTMKLGGVAHRAAVRADGAIRPHDALDRLASFIFGKSGD